MAATMDLYATLLKAGGGELPNHPVDGHDLMPFLKGRTSKSPREDFLYFRGRRPPRGVRVGPWKLHYGDGVELFNLDVDPNERYNRAADKPEIVNRLKGKLEEMARAMGTTAPDA
jgi:arylsulfatase A-like enzyme